MKLLEIRPDTVTALYAAQTERGHKDCRLDTSASFRPPNDEDDELDVNVACQAVGERFWLLVSTLASRAIVGGREGRLEVLVPSHERLLTGAPCVELAAPVTRAVRTEYDLDEKRRDEFAVAVRSLADDVSAWARGLTDRDRTQLGVHLRKDGFMWVVRKPLDELFQSWPDKIRPLSELGERTYKGELPSF